MNDDLNRNTRPISDDELRVLLDALNADKAAIRAKHGRGERLTPNERDLLGPDVPFVPRAEFDRRAKRERRRWLARKRQARKRVAEQRVRLALEGLQP